MKWLVAAAAILLTATTAAAQNRYPPLTNAEREAADTLRSVANEYNEDSDFEAAERTIRRVIATRGFSGFRPELQELAYRQLAYVLIARETVPCDEAIPLAARLAESTVDDARGGRMDWAIYMAAADRCDDDDHLATAVAGAVRNQPALFAGMPDQTVLQALRNIEDRTTLAHFVNGGWRPQDPATDLSWQRLRLTRLHLRANDVAAASEVAQALTTNGRADAHAIILLLVEKEFDRVTQADPETFDFEAIQRWQLRNLETSAAAEPNNLNLQTQWVEALLVANRLDDALAAADAAIARIDASTSTSLAFTDQEEQANWMHDARGRVLRARGSHEEALAALQRGVESGERGHQNVSQLLNRAGDLIDLGRGAEALRATADMDEAFASPYGEMVRLSIRVCGYAQTGNDARMRSTLDEMRAREADSLLQVYSAALCANETDLAARTLVRILADPDERIFPLLSLQNFIGEEPITEHQRLMIERTNALHARPDVRAAIDRVARIQSFPARSPY